MNGNMGWVRRLPEVNASRLLAEVQEADEEIARLKRAMSAAKAARRAAVKRVEATVAKAWTPEEIARAKELAGC